LPAFELHMVIIYVFLTNKGTETDATTLFRVNNCSVHPHYYDYHNDIAVCKIIGTIQYNSKVGPVCLPFHHSRDSFDGSNVTALGQYRFPIAFFLCLSPYFTWSFLLFSLFYLLVVFPFNIRLGLTAIRRRQGDQITAS